MISIAWVVVSFFVCTSALGALSVWLMAQSQKRERQMVDRLVEQMANIHAIGSPLLPEAVITREESPETRAMAHFSEETIEKGIQHLRDTVYANSGLAMPGYDELRLEVLSALAGMTPEPIIHGVRVRD